MRSNEMWKLYDEIVPHMQKKNKIFGNVERCLNII